MLKYQLILEKCNPSQTHSELNELLLELEKIDIDIVLEIGVHRGGSTRVWQQALKPKLLIGVDWSIEPNAIMDGLTLIEGKSQEQTTMDKVLKALNGQLVDFLFIDGSHYYEDVKNDFKMYYDLVKQGGAIGFHDVILTGNNTCEVYKFWNEIKDLYNTKTISHKDQHGIVATGEGLLWK